MFVLMLILKEFHLESQNKESRLEASLHFSSADLLEHNHRQLTTNVNETLKRKYIFLFWASCT